jgi:geranylgeranyl diphosphate/geranylgeranyl-bacteriochlorophyllide a reductase
VSELDVIVAGAGPAGAIAARDLARTGARVALVDASFPREKPCGGGVTARALALVGPEMPELAPLGRTVRSVRFEAGGAAATVDLTPETTLDVFSRDTFDSALLGLAVGAGARHVDARVRMLSRDGGFWRAELSNGQAVRAPWLLGADGVGGIVRRHVFRAFERRHLSIAAGSYVDGTDCHEIVIGFVDHPPGYLWSFPRPGHLAVGACAQADEASTADMHGIADRWLNAYAPAAGLLRKRYAWPIPSLDAAALERELPSGVGWMLLGDAAGLVDPITREGIYFAIRSGQLAATTLLGANSSREYRAAIRDEMHAELRRAALLKAGLFRPRFTRLLIQALNRSASIRDIMRELIAGRQPYRGLKRRLLKTLEIELMLRTLSARRTHPARGQ